MPRLTRLNSKEFPQMQRSKSPMIRIGGQDGKRIKTALSSSKDRVPVGERYIDINPKVYGLFQQHEKQ